MFVANVTVITFVACRLDTKLGCVETYMSCQLKPGGQETWVGYLPSLRICRFNQSLHGAGFWVTWYQRIGINGYIEACKKTKPPTSSSSPLSRSPLLTLSTNWWRERFNWEADSWWLSWLIFSATPPGLARPQHHSHYHHHYHQHYHSHSGEEHK